MERKGVVGASTPQWVSVKDRLPDDGDTVLVIGRKVGEMRFDIPRISEYSGGEWWADSGDYLICYSGVEITHWMPMPEPPKEVDHES